MKKRAVQLSVIAALVAAAVILRDADGPLPATPEAAVNAFFEAAENADDVAYLALVDGELLDRLRNTRSQLGRDEFRDGLRRSGAGIKGLAVMRAGEAPDGSVTLNVDIVFADRNERQRFTLAPKRGGWAIVEISSTATTRPEVPYGTPVFD